MKKITFIGLGVMGYNMATHLAKSGQQVCAFNRTHSRAKNWLQQFDEDSLRTNLSIETTIAMAVKDADIIFSCVGNDLDLYSIAEGENGIISNIRTDSIWIDHSTVSKKAAQTLAAMTNKMGAFFIDAPVSGGEQGAILGQLCVMCGAEPSVFDRAKAIMSCYSKTVKLMGPVGNGQLTKMVNQICIAGVIQSLAEALEFAENSDLDIDKVIDVISNGAAQSWQMENRYKTMMAGEYNHGFAVDWMRKDFAIVLKEAQINGSELPVTELVDQFYADIQRQGGGRWDTSSLLTRLNK